MSSLPTSCNGRRNIASSDHSGRCVAAFFHPTVPAPRETAVNLAYGNIVGDRNQGQGKYVPLADPAFGYVFVDGERSYKIKDKLIIIEKYINETPGIRHASRYTKDLFLLEIYLKEYLGFELKDRDTITKLLSPMRLEDYRTHSRAVRRRDEYRANRIKEDLGMNLAEFLDLPTYMVDDILNEQRTILQREREDREREAQRLQREAEQKEHERSRNHAFPQMPFNPNYGG